MNAFERRLHKRFESVDLAAMTQGVVIDVHQNGRRIGLISEGQTYRYYDLASLTKILFAGSAALFHFSESPGDLDLPLREVLPWWRHATTSRQLLTHTAGLEWWLPMYQRLKGPLNPTSRWRQMTKQLAKIKPKTRKQAVYSDVDLWLFAAFMQELTGLSIEELWLQTATRLNFRDKDLFFHPGNQAKYARHHYAPTEDCPWRGRILQGEVHDENTWALGGVAMNAGLFGGIDTVSRWGLELRKGFLGESRIWTNTKMVRHFTGRRIPRSQGDWGFGFMKPSKGRASCGRYFSLRSFGHTGFTGTSLWYDPVQDLLVVILSNRVHPTRENRSFVSFRPRLHDWVCESLA